MKVALINKEKTNERLVRIVPLGEMELDTLKKKAEDWIKRNGGDLYYIILEKDDCNEVETIYTKEIETYLNGEPYHGRAAYINGYNGYTATEDNGLLCALIDDWRGLPSCWDNDGNPNTLTDKDGNKIVNKALRGVIIVI